MRIARINMADTYIFDKRIVKKKLIKFLIELVIIFPILIAVNYILAGLTADWVMILIDVLLGLLLIWGVGTIYDKIAIKRAQKKLDKLEALKKREKDEKLESAPIQNQTKEKPQITPKKKRKRRNRKVKNDD